MIKKVLVVLFFVVSLATLAWARHDGPFPMVRAEGTWASQNVSGLYVTIHTIGAASNNQVLTEVDLFNGSGTPIAHGRTVHDLNDSVLCVKMMLSGKPILVTFSVADDGTNTSGMHLVMHIQTLDYQGQPQAETAYILER